MLSYSKLDARRCIWRNKDRCQCNESNGEPAVGKALVTIYRGGDNTDKLPMVPRMSSCLAIGQ